MVRGVLFDLDGTLLDHDAACDAGFARNVAELLPALPAAARPSLLAEWRRREELHYDEYLSGAITFAEQRRRRVHAVLAHAGAAPLDDAGADAWFAGYLRHYAAAWTLFDDVLPLLDLLAAARPELALGVITNGEDDRQRAKLAALGIAERLPGFLASGELGVAKPAPAIFAAACARIGLDPGEVAYVGDRLDVDARGARDAGLHGVWLDRRGRGGADGVPAIATLDELPTVLGIA